MDLSYNFLQIGAFVRVIKTQSVEVCIENSGKGRRVWAGGQGPQVRASHPSRPGAGPVPTCPRCETRVHSDSVAAPCHSLIPASQGRPWACGNPLGLTSGVSSRVIGKPKGKRASCGVCGQLTMLLSVLTWRSNHWVPSDKTTIKLSLSRPSLQPWR